MDGESLARSEAESPEGCEQDANNITLKYTKKESKRLINVIQKL